MAGGILAILDDIAILLDDAALMSKVAAKKTAGILGDDLAVNAEKATGFQASRELPVLFAITKGSFINKLIILPLAFLLSAYASWLIIPVLLIGGAYLCYESIEKVYHVLSHTPQEKPAAETISNEEQLLKVEDAKIKSAIRTDFILSVEIIVIALGTVMNKPFLLQVVVVSFIALLATVGVYGVVALIVRMDDTGFYLIARARNLKGKIAVAMNWSGSILVASLPKVIHALGIIGTVAMLLVGGGMFTHNIKMVHDLLAFLPSLLADLLMGILIGALILVFQLLMKQIIALSRV